MRLSYSLFIIFGFLAVFLLLEGLYMYWTDAKSPEVQRVQQRLRLMTGAASGKAASSLLKQRMLSETPELQRLMLLLPRVDDLDRLLLQAGSRKMVGHLLGVCLGLGVLGVLVAMLLRWPWWGALFLMAALAALPVLRLKWQRATRLNLIGEQLPDALDLISRALRAGHAFSAALAMVGNEAPEPIASEFRATFEEINFGISTQNALNNMAIRVPVADLRFFVLAVVIQLETGGNLAELLSMLANLIRERFKLFGKIRVLAAEGKLSAYILTGLPFCVAGAIQVLNPGYLNVLFTDPTGIRLVLTALFMMLLGGFVMWRIIDIRV
jgi:tight adherence protein B